MSGFAGRDRILAEKTRVIINGCIADQKGTENLLGYLDPLVTNALFGGPLLQPVT